MPVNSRYTAHEVADIVDRTGALLVVVADGFLGAPRSPTCAPSAPLPQRARQHRPLTLDDRAATRPPDRRHGRGSTPRRRRHARRRRRHPVHLRHHRPLQGRDVRAPADHRRRPGLGRTRRRARRRPLPGGQPVLPLLRLQDRHRGRAAHRRDALPGRDVRSGRHDGADRVGADHAAARRARRSTSPCSPPPAAPTTTCPRCGWPSPVRPWCRSCSSSGCATSWASTRSSPPSA